METLATFKIWGYEPLRDDRKAKLHCPPGLTDKLYNAIEDLSYVYTRLELAFLKEALRSLVVAVSIYILSTYNEPYSKKSNRAAK